MNKYLVIIFIIFFIWGFFIEPNLLVVKRYFGNYWDKNSSIKKIVFVSDFHRAKGDIWRLKRIIKLINKQNPDLVLLGGDYIKGNNGKTTVSIEKISAELKNINAPMISVLGNHDGWYDKYTVKKALESAGIKVLTNSSVKFKDLYIAGVEDLQTGIPDIETALENTESPVILLSHTPDIYYDVKSDVDLILAGHVHGGQVRFFGKSFIVPSQYGDRFACGEYKETQNRMIVTKGLGTSILNVRFMTLPEIVVIEMNRE